MADKNNKSTAFGVDRVIGSIDSVYQDYINGLIHKGEFISSSIKFLEDLRDEDLNDVRVTADQYGYELTPKVDQNDV